MRKKHDTNIKCACCMTNYTLNEKSLLCKECEAYIGKASNIMRDCHNKNFRALNNARYRQMIKAQAQQIILLKKELLRQHEEIRELSRTVDESEDKTL